MYKYFLAIIICLIYACSSKIEKVNTKVDKSALSTEQADSVTLYYSNNGFMKAKLQAKTFIHVIENTQPFVEMKDGLKVTFYGADNTITSTLTADNGRYYEKNSNVLVRDSVVVKNIKNETLNTDELVWNEKSQIFFTEKRCTISTPTQIIYGDGMEANQDFTHYKILNPKGIIAVKNNKIPMK